VEDNTVLGQNNKNMIISICVTLPKVAKASSALSVTCCYCQQFNGKINDSFKQYLHWQSFSRETVGDKTCRRKYSTWAKQQKHDHFRLYHFAHGCQGKYSTFCSVLLLQTVSWENQYFLRQYLHWQCSFHETASNSYSRKTILYLPLLPWATQHKYDNFDLSHFVKGGQGE
jgi:hypothetical protein